MSEEAAAIRVLLDGLTADRLTRIVDVGANPVNVPPYKGLLDLRGCEVVGFEPQRSAYDELLKTKSDLETYLPFAVGDGTEKELKIYQTSGFTSVYEPNQPGLKYLGGRKWGNIVDRVPLETVALDGASEIGEFDLLKIDIQGGELDVFKGGEAALAKAMVVITELRFFPIYAGEPMIGGVDSELRRQGFELHKLMFTKAKPLPNSQGARLKTRKVRDQLIDGDAVYIRDMGRKETYSDEQIRHLCITASAVFQSHSLVVHCLDELVRRGAAAPDLPERYVDALPADVRA